MTGVNDSADEIALAAVRSPRFRRATFGGPIRNRTGSNWIRVTLRSVAIRERRMIQFEYFEATQAIAKNVELDDVEPALREILAVGFANGTIHSDGEEIEIRRSKKGKVRVARRSIENAASNDSHNRAKDVPLPDGLPDRLLETMGIATPDGRVRASMRPKFTQINEFLKFLAHSLEPAGLTGLNRPLAILDCGCGSSHLTLAVHHWLNDIRKIPATILGVDVNDAVIRASAAKAHAIGSPGLSFACGTIGEVDARADIVLALHACDTATDDALAQAVRSEAKLILSVPCCHKHLNRQLKAVGASEVFRPILRHGILHERVADILTDSFRALALRILGYKTDVVEFVNLEHTARNVLIRAVRTASGDQTAFVEEYRELKRFWNVTPYLESAFGEGFRNKVAN